MKGVSECSIQCDVTGEDRCLGIEDRERYLGILVNESSNLSSVQTHKLNKLKQRGLNYSKFPHRGISKKDLPLHHQKLSLENLAISTILKFQMSRLHPRIQSLALPQTKNRSWYNSPVQLRSLPNTTSWTSPQMQRSPKLLLWRRIWPL